MLIWITPGCRLDNPPHQQTSSGPIPRAEPPPVAGPALASPALRPQALQQPLVDQKDQLNDLLTRFPQAVKTIGRAGGIYGDFFNFYACDIALKLPGLQPGGPVRTVKITSQPSGRCTPQ